LRDDEAMKRHMDAMAAMRRRMLWVHYLIVALGAWLATSPFQFGLFDARPFRPSATSPPNATSGRSRCAPR
jgi:hypothetical protein